MTRTLKFSAIALLAVVVLWACGGASGPKAVGEKFLNAINSGDYETAKKYATKEAQASLDMMASMPAGEKKDAPKLEMGEVKEEGDKATLAYKENGVDKTLNLKKEDGEWKAEWTKGGTDTGTDMGTEMEDAVNDAVEAVDTAATEGTEGTEEGHEGHEGH